MLSTPSTGAAAGTCWYRDPAHRPTLGSCPSACQGPPTHAERVGGGEQRLYCDAHAAWRRAGIRLPTLVRTLSPAEQAATLRP